MIRIRLGKRVPKNAVNLAYVHGPGYSVDENISLMDTSYTRPENVCAIGGDVVVDLAISNRVDTQDIRLSNRSVLHQKQYRAAPLFYSYRIGRGTYTVLSYDADPGDLAASRDEIRKHLTILDRQNNVLNDLLWDIEVVGTDGTTGYTVDLFLARRQRAGETFKVKYDAKDGLTLLPNHIEVINSVEYFIRGADYALTWGSDGYSVSGLALTGFAPGVGLFYRGTGAAGQAVVNGGMTTLTLTDDAAATYNITLTGKTVEEIVAEVNELGLPEYLAVQLSTSAVARLTAGTFAISQYGTVLRLNQMVHVRYNEETRIRALKPHSGPASTPWYPRVDPGEFLQAGQIGAADVNFLFAVPEYTNQTWSYTYGQPWRDFSNDLAEVLDDKILRVHRHPVRDGSLTLYQGDRDVTSKITDIDLLNGIIFLASRVKGAVVADYSYEERTYVYTGVDLNTTHLHRSDLFGKYIGIYATPWRILSANPTLRQEFSTCIRHVVRDTYAEVVAQVAGVLFDDSSDPQAFLLGVYRPVLTADLDEVKIVDTRKRGGGITDEITSTNEPESDFFWDVGRWRGLPFQDKGTVVVSVPEEIFGTDSSSIRMDIPVSETGYVSPTGKLSRSYVQGVIDKHLAAGHLGIIWPRTGVLS